MIGIHPAGITARAVRGLGPCWHRYLEWHASGRQVPASATACGELGIWTQSIAIRGGWPFASVADKKRPQRGGDELGLVLWDTTPDGWGTAGSFK